MVLLPGALLLSGCFVIAAAGATVLWSLVQAALDLAPAVHRRSAPARISAGAHLRRAARAATVVLLVACVPTLLRRIVTLTALLGLS